MNLKHQNRAAFWTHPAFWMGLVGVFLYWLWIQPYSTRGYLEDFCWDLSRKVMAKNISIFGKPTFYTDEVMTPSGMSVAFFSWSMERDWLGSYFWTWNKDFNFIWYYTGVGFLISYLGVGYILKKMHLSLWWAWLLSTLVVVVHIPRHYKTWYHVEYLAQHWVYLAFFLDAWIWQRFFREKRWSLHLESWRGLIQLAVLGTPGYFWGPTILSWMMVRLLILLKTWKERSPGSSSPLQWPWPQIEPLKKASVVPIFLTLIFVILDLRWFLPLLAEMKKVGLSDSGYGWWAHPLHVFRPLWLDKAYEIFQSITGFPWGWFPWSLSWKLPPIDKPETVVTIGWLFWVPALLGLQLIRKKAKGPGIWCVMPFILILILAIGYFGLGGKPYPFQRLLQQCVPFMKFFRVTSRWGVFFPQLVTILIVLCWPELQNFFRKNWHSQGQRLKTWSFIFIALSATEIARLSLPVLGPAELHPSTAQLLNKIQSTAGSSVLDLPFCVAGGNGVCTVEQCPQYPFSTVGQCFSNWHDKKIYGVYLARLTPAQCEIYNQPPYSDWFTAWRQNRCFSPQEWDHFCAYLDQHTELSALLVYPKIWTAIEDPLCRAEIDRRLGTPEDQGTFFSKPSRDGLGEAPSQVLRYQPRCLQKSLKIKTTGSGKENL